MNMQNMHTQIAVIIKHQSSSNLKHQTSNMTLQTSSIFVVRGVHYPSFERACIKHQKIFGVCAKIQAKIKQNKASKCSGKKKRGCYSGAPLLSTYVILHVTALFGQNTTLHTLYLHSTYTHETSLSNFQISHGSKPMTLKTGLLAQFFTLNKKTPTKKANSSSFRSKKLKSLKPESAAPRRKRTALFYLKEKKRKTRRRRRIQ